MSLIKETKIATTADIMAPLIKTLDKLRAAQGARKEHIQANTDEIKRLSDKNRAHQKEIEESQNFINGFESTFGIK